MSYRRHKMMVSRNTPILKTEILTNGTIGVSIHRDNKPGDIEDISYSLDNGETWTTWVNTDGRTAALVKTIIVEAGDVVCWQGNVNRWSPITGYTPSFFTGTATFNLSGEIVAMMKNKKYIPRCGAFRMFQGSKVVSAYNLILPSRIDQAGCRDMFYSCKSLTTAPKTFYGDGSKYGYSAFFEMFLDCSALVNPPELPATNIPQQCYTSLFRKCTNLSKAPKLNALFISNSSYRMMFENTKVDYVFSMHLDDSPFTETKTGSWLSNCPENGIVVKHINAVWTTTGASGVPTGWTIIYYDPALDKYYLDQNRITECDDHGNVID